MPVDESKRPLPRSALAALALFALAIRLVRLSHFSYWLDEILESFIVHGTWTGIWHTLSWQGIQAPLDYAVQKLLDGFHPSEAATRLPSVLWGTLMVPTAAALIARRAGRASGIAVGVLLVVSPFHVRYSQEVRPYALGMLTLCLSLLALDRFLDRPTPRRLALLYLASLATAYALYVAALALLVAGAALVSEDAFSPDRRRSRIARRFLAWSPLFGAALWIGFLPWWPVFLTGIRSEPMGVAPRWTLSRIPRFLSFFGFGHADLQPLGAPGVLFAAGCIAGLVIAFRKPGLRFVAAWSLAGFALLELLEQRHPVFDSIFHYTPVGLSLVVLFALPIAQLTAIRPLRPITAGLLVLSAAIAGLSVREYFRSGRPDWRPLARWLKATPKEDRIITDSDYTELCVGYYVAGPDWFGAMRRHTAPRDIVSLKGDPAALPLFREKGRKAWLVRMADSSVPSEGADREVSFPTAEGGGVFVRHLDPPR